jgi:hypothetical protein
MNTQSHIYRNGARWVRAAVLIWCLGVIGALVVHRARAAESAATIRGTVKDQAGKPQAKIKVQVCGMEKFSDGAWTRELKTGLMPSFTTDKEGRLAIPLHRADIAYDLYFDKPGLAPAFLYRISGSSGELSVVLKRGLTVSGKVTRSSGGKVESVAGASVELRLPYVDLWYQRRTVTDREGRYSFQVTPPPEGRKWQVVFEGKVIQLEVKEGKAVAAPDFDSGAKLREGQNRSGKEAPGE